MRVLLLSWIYHNRLKFFLYAWIATVVFLPGMAVSSERLAVISSKANIRSGPGTNYEVLWEVEKYHPVIILETKEKWCRFRDYEGDEGWIHRPMLGEINTVITVKDKCNIRSEPGEKKPVVFTTEKGIPFKVLEKNDGWLHVQHADGDKGWVHPSLVW